MFLSVRCQLSSVVSSSSNHPLSPTPYDRLINSGWNSSFALSRRSDIISSRSLFPLSLSVFLSSSRTTFSPLSFFLYRFLYVMSLLNFFSSRVSALVNRGGSFSRGRPLARFPCWIFFTFFFWDRRGARRGSVSRRRLIIPLRQYVFNTPLIGRLPV